MKIENLKIAFEKGYRVINNSIVNINTGTIRKLFQEKRNEPGFIPYPRFSVNFNGKIISVWAHQLSAYQKYGEKKCAQNVVVRHKNNNYNDFSENNISLGTQRDNILDQNPDMRREKAIRASKAAVNKIRFNKYRYAVLEYTEDF